MLGGAIAAPDQAPRLSGRKGFDSFSAVLLSVVLHEA
jgi:hypothetical protein